MIDLINKYNRPTPRYTSYPPANFFTPDYTGEEYLRAVEQSNSEGIGNLSFYIHVPFCPKICHYCACNAYNMQGRSTVESYMQAVLRELEIVCERLDKTRPITQIHYGGGTPTAIPLRYLAQINARLTSLFPLAEGAEIAIECHPAYLSLGGWQELVDAGFNRVSIGVQDFSPEVLRAVNRQPSREAFEDIFALLRRAGLSINLDLIYGLPKQSVESFADNIRRAIALSPDRLVTFSYAHVPWVKPAQNILAEMGLPSGEVKAEMFAKAKAMLEEAGYRAVGLDHFVRPDDPLWLAVQSGELHRNFQGYCTRRTTGQVYALGVTSISQLSAAFAQNTKSIEQYIASIAEGRIPTERGYQLSRAEQIAGEVIASVMCNYAVRWQDVADAFALTPSDLLQHIYLNEELLSELKSDGLIEWDDAGISVPQRGRAFIRLVAYALDPLMAEPQGKLPYSMAL